MELPWLEKYRPQQFSDIVGNKDTVEKLNLFSQQRSIPNLLISGPAGIGKTTCIKVLVKSILGSQYNSSSVLELNASDERGIDTVRTKIKTFAQTRVTLLPGRHKIVILEEADNVTASAQNALRRIMEIFSETTRFILSCNLSNKVIEAIQSRCAVLRFTKLSEKDILERILRILELEKINTYTNDGLDAILYLSDGDLRNAINSLQATYSGFGNITSDNVYMICDVPHPFVLSEILKLCADGEINDALNKVNGLLNKGYSANDIASSFFSMIKRMEDIDQDLLLEFIRIVGTIQMRINDGVDTKIQINGLVAKLCRASMKNKDIYDL